jgi:N-acetylneuraminic acid mutarotase
MRLTNAHARAHTGQNTWQALEVQQVPNFARHQAVTVDDRIFCFGGYDLERFYELAMFVPGTYAFSLDPSVFIQRVHYSSV